jgi:hypothetical protein
LTDPEGKRIPISSRIRSIVSFKTRYAYIGEKHSRSLDIFKVSAYTKVEKGTGIIDRKKENRNELISIETCPNLNIVNI